MQTGFRLIEDHEARRAGRKHGGGPQAIAQGAVGQFGGVQGSKQAMLMHRHGEAAVLPRYLQAGAGEGVGNSRVERRRQRKRMLTSMRTFKGPL